MMTLIFSIGGTEKILCDSQANNENFDADALVLIPNGLTLQPKVSPFDDNYCTGMHHFTEQLIIIYAGKAASGF